MSRKDKLEWLDDGLLLPEVGGWSEDKYRAVAIYNKLFTTGMKYKFKRVYIDLFAGAGASIEKGTDRIVKGSPLLALDLDDKYDKYIFCEKDPGRAEALEQRINSNFKEVDYLIITGDSNKHLVEIHEDIPRGNNVLSFCFIDPYKLRTLKWKTVKFLAQHRRMDFLIMFPTGYEINLNRKRYIENNSEIITEALGIDTWKSEWDGSNQRENQFPKFVAEQFGAQMQKLEYLRDGLATMKRIKKRDQNLWLYHLAFYSRNPRGYAFWKSAINYSGEQTSLFDFN